MAAAHRQPLPYLLLDKVASAGSHLCCSPLPSDARGEDLVAWLASFWLVLAGCTRWGIQTLQAVRESLLQKGEWALGTRALADCHVLIGWVWLWRRGLPTNSPGA